MKIIKMHGIGNDYVYVNGFDTEVSDPPALARKISDRHFGVGGDGLIIIQPPSNGEADCRMEMYNADGSRAQMCGNGIRCVGKFVRDHGIVTGDRVRVETDSGLLELQLRTAPSPDGVSRTVESVTVDMGEPRWAQRDLPARVTDDPEAPALRIPLEVAGMGTFEVSLISTGNPHCVVRLGADQPLGGDVDALDLATIGPRFENHPAFPERINTEFIVVRNRGEIDLRVWERGSGETLACGTGACAAVVACHLNGWTKGEVVVHLRGGELQVNYDEASGHVFMTGPATEVFSAELNPAWLES